MRHSFPRALVLLFVSLLCSGQFALKAETPVDLYIEPAKGSRGGAVVSVTQTSQMNGMHLIVDYPEGEGGGGYVACQVQAFVGPLSHITFNAKGNMSMARIGVRGSDKNVGSAGVKLPDLDEVMKPYSVDFSGPIQTLEAGGDQFIYPITEVIIGFRYGKMPQDFLEITDLVLHPVE